MITSLRACGVGRPGGLGAARLKLSGRIPEAWGVAYSDQATADRRRRRGEARTYDFRRPVRLAREHAHILRVAMQTFARQSSTLLTTSLRVICQLSSKQLE